MQARGIKRLLRRGLGRRMLILLCLAGLLPVIVTASLAYFEIRRGTETEAYDDLRVSAKTYGMDIFARIRSAGADAARLTTYLSQDGVTAFAEHDYLLDGVRTVWVDTAAGTTHVYGDNDVSLPILGGTTIPGNSGVLLRVGSAQSDLVFVNSTILADSGHARVVVLVEGESIWTPDEGSPYDTDFCVYTDAIVELYCTHADGDSIRAALGEGGERNLRWELDGEPQMAAAWQIFLAGAFNSAPIELVASQPRDHAMRSYTDFRRVFLPALVLVLALAILLSLNVIDRSLDPLQKLSRAAKALAAGKLAHRVNVDTDDEFEDVATAFNKMASRLGRQIATLEAMSGIDRHILTGTSFEEVATHLLEQLLRVTPAEFAAIIVADESSARHARAISAKGGNVSSEKIGLPRELGRSDCELRVVRVDELHSVREPYRDVLAANSQNYSVVVPVVSDDRAKALLVIASSVELDVSEGVMQSCTELAGRFAVALSSVEREDRLFQQANFDDLTGLPNRQLLKQRLADMVERARVEHHSGALLYLDLDRFKEVNDVHGHSVGDIVLGQAAERIVNEVRDEDLVSRLGGDEFVVVLPALVGDERAKSTATRLINRLTEVFSVFGVNHFVGASIGIVMFPADGESVETLLKNADAAMYRAKEAGRARYEFFNVELNAESHRKIALERDLRLACRNRELRLSYQPQLEVRTGALAGAEALMRWRHPEHGLVSPHEFIPLAEESDLILELGRWVIEQTCRDLRRVLDEGLHPGPVSINISARQLRDSGVVRDVLGALHRHQINAGFLQLEVTETAVAQNRDTAISVLRTLRDAGVRIALDDFGTGYSSLSYLQNMPFDVIKIDKSFVARIGEDESSAKICRTIISMAAQLDKVSIAEGVETRKQLDVLKDAGCNIAQGFFYNEPMEVEDFLAFMRKQDEHTQRRKALEIAT